VTPNKTTEYYQNRLSDIREAEYDQDVRAALLDFLLAYDPDSFRLQPPILQGNDSREEPLNTSSRLAYASTLHRTAQWLEASDDSVSRHGNDDSEKRVVDANTHDVDSLTTATASDLNRVADGRLNGRHHSVDADGVSVNTVHQNQIAWRSFARFHRDHPDGVDLPLNPDDIVLVEQHSNSVDERDMFDSEEFRALRDHCTNDRDRAMLELLIYTGQRHNALRMLKYRDVQPDEGESGKLYLPDIEEGLKGAEGKRPLLGAQQACRQWKRSHPTQNGDDAFLTHIYEWDNHDGIEPGDHLSTQQFGEIPKRIASRADVEKPCNPHNFRHYFVTMAVSKHGMSMDTVRHLIGHAADSRELERTYQHLVDEDHIENAELDMGIRDQREESLTPAQCFTCEEPLEPSWSACPNCGRQYGPDAANVSDTIENRKGEGALAATDEQTQRDVQTVMSVLDDEQKMAQLVALVNRLDADDPEDAAESLSN